MLISFIHIELQKHACFSYASVLSKLDLVTTSMTISMPGSRIVRKKRNMIFSLPCCVASRCNDYLVKCAFDILISRKQEKTRVGSTNRGGGVPTR